MAIAPNIPALKELGSRLRAEAEEKFRNLPPTDRDKMIKIYVEDGIYGAVEQPFAIIDILGFSEIVNSTQLKDIYERYTQLVITAWTSKGTQPWPAPQFVMVSDSIFIFPPRDTKPDQYFKYFTCYLSVLISNSVRALKDSWGFPLRGAISFGKLIAERAHQLQGLVNPLLEIPPFPLLLGQPVVQAYRWEQQQKWLGASIEPTSCAALLKECPAEIQRLQEENVLIDWEIPTADGPVPSLAINFVFEKYVIEILRIMEEHEAVASPKVKPKYHATRLFIEHIQSNKKFNRY